MADEHLAEFQIEPASYCHAGIVLSAIMLIDILLQMVDKASSGGSILDSIGGAEGTLGFAKKLFGK